MEFQTITSKQTFRAFNLRNFKDETHPEKVPTIIELLMSHWKIRTKREMKSKRILKEMTGEFFIVTHNFESH